MRGFKCKPDQAPRKHFKAWAAGGQGPGPEQYSKNICKPDMASCHESMRVLCLIRPLRPTRQMLEGSVPQGGILALRLCPPAGRVHVMQACIGRLRSVHMQHHILTRHEQTTTPFGHTGLSLS